MGDLFITLKSEHYEAFERGEKKFEYRRYGARQNEKTCRVGRGVTLSKGYGKKNRMRRTVESFQKVHGTWGDKKTQRDIYECFGTNQLDIAKIGISDD